jgi:hypothetical protein
MLQHILLVNYGKFSKPGKLHFYLDCARDIVIQNQEAARNKTKKA